MRYRKSEDFTSPSVDNFWFWHRRRILDLVRSAIPTLPSDAPIGVDVGCGDGYVARKIANESSFLHFIGVDAFWDHVRFIDAENAYDESAKRVEPVMGNVYAIPIKDGAADLVICSEVVEHLTDDARALAELHRVLAPGGVLILATPNGAPLPHRLVWALRGKRPPDVSDPLPVKGTAPDSQLHGHINVQDLPYWRSALRKANFVVEAVRPVTFFYGAASLDRHPLRFALALVIQALTSRFSWGHHFSEGLIIRARRPRSA